MGHYVNQSGVYLGEYGDSDETQAAVIEYDLLEVPSAPERADQFWNGTRWQYPSHHYVASDGSYEGFLEDGNQAQDSIIVPSAPEDATDQYWANSQWTWRVHYYRDADGNFIGACAGPDSDVPGDWIEVPVAPDDARQMWNGESWDALLVETI